MRSVKPMKTAKIGTIILSVILCALGILLIVMPNFSSKVIGILLGAYLILFGGIRLVGYFSKDLYRLAYQYDLALGALMIVLGVIVLVRPDNVMNLICIALGCAIMADGLFKLQIALDSRRFGINKWWLIMLLAIITVAAGLLLIFRPTESRRLLLILLGISLFAEGILNLSVALTAVKIISHQQPDVIEAEYIIRKD